MIAYLSGKLLEKHANTVIVDVGGVKFAPGPAVAIEDEIALVVPVVRELALLGDVSVDTFHPAVARAAIEAGAQDFEPGEEANTTIFITEPTEVDLVSRALPAHGFTVLSAKLGYKPKNPVDPASLAPEALEEVEAFLAAIDENDDVQNVYVGLAG